MDDSVPEYESVGGCASVLKACPVGRAHSAWGAHFVGGGPVSVMQNVWARPLAGFFFCVGWQVP